MNDLNEKMDFEKVRSTLREAVARNIISDGRYDGFRVTMVGLFVHHGMSTREIALLAGVSEPAVRKLILSTYNRVSLFIEKLDRENKNN